MNCYCTYFDRNYLAQGVALWRSLQRHDPAARLWVLALDASSAAVLRALGDAGLVVIDVDELLGSDVALAAAQRDRSRSEFIFTITPCWLRWLFDRCGEIERIAYVDADLLFFASPAPAWEAMGDGAVLVVPHRFPSWHDDRRRTGVFNVGWVAFRRSEVANRCIDWWRARCLEGCAVAGDGVVFGDQKYLDEWPNRFGGAVRVCAYPGVNLAPWNWAGHRCIVTKEGSVMVDAQPLVFFHFAQFRWIGGQWWDSGQLEYGVMSRALRRALYGAYVERLREAEAILRKTDPGFALNARGWWRTLGRWPLAGARMAMGQFWFRSLNGSWWAMGFGGRWSGRLLGWYRGIRREG